MDYRSLMKNSFSEMRKYSNQTVMVTQSLEPIPVGVYCCSQFGYGQRGTTEAYTQYVRIIRFAPPSGRPEGRAKHR